MRGFGQWVMPIQDVITAIVLELGSDKLDARSYTAARQTVRNALRKYYDDGWLIGFEEGCDWMIDQYLNEMSITPF